MKRPVIILLVVVLTFIIGCRPRSTILEHREPMRIVSLAPNITEILAAIGHLDRLVGVTQHCNWPEQVRSMPKVGTFWQPDLEAIVAARPQLIIGLDIPSHRLISPRLGRLGYRCLLLRLDRLNDLYQAIQTIGQQTCCQTQAQALCRQLQVRTAGSVRSSGNRPRVLFVVQRTPLRVAGQDTFINDAIELAGGRNAIGPTPYKYPPVGAEQLVAARADTIIEACAGMSSGQADRFWRRFQDLPAVRNGRIYQIDQDLISRLGPRIADGIEQIARFIKSG